MLADRFQVAEQRERQYHQEAEDQTGNQTAGEGR